MKHIQSLTIIPKNIERIPKLVQADQRLADSGISLTWELLAMLAPELEQLVNDHAPFQHDGSEHDDQIAVLFSRLVGYYREDLHPILCTQQAYDIAHDKFYYIPEAGEPCLAAASDADGPFYPGD